MEDQLITFETAKLAKEKGIVLEKCHCGGFPECICKDKRPTQSLLQKELREKHNIHVNCKYSSALCCLNYPLNKQPIYRCIIDNRSGKGNNIMTELFLTYEKALEVGLQKALDLIK